MYRKGTLYFFNNTVVSTRTGNTTLFRLSTNSETANCFNNIVYVTATGERLAMLDSYGILNIQNNWMKTDWVNSHSGLSGSLNDLGGNISGSMPGFADETEQDFHLIPASVCIDKGTSVPGGYPVNYEYVKHLRKEERNISGIIDLGAYEYSLSTLIRKRAWYDLIIFPNPGHERVFVKCPLNIYTMSLLDNSGRELFLVTTPDNQTNIDITRYRKGIYFLKFQTEAGIIVRKLIID